MPYFLSCRLAAAAVLLCACIHVHAATTESLGGSAPPAREFNQSSSNDEVLSRTLGDFLAKAPPVTGSSLTGFYAEVPDYLDSAVRRIAEENYTSAVALLLPELDKLTDKREHARVQMWLGLCYGLKAIDYPTGGWTLGTSATAHLREAIAADPDVFSAPDVARVLAEMVANGWANEDPTTSLDKYEKKAEESRKAVDFYFAGIISKRLSARAWSYSDTTEQDKRSLSNFSKAVARDPGRYENWPAYLRALMPVGMHDLATTESYKMYEHFQKLRTPTLGDQGPAFMLLQVASYRTMQQDQEFLTSLEKQMPDAPFPVFERAMRDIETTPTDALKRFPEFIQRVKSGSIKLEPREAGYLPSAYYKLGFLQQQMNQIAEARDSFLHVKEISPNYAELNNNLAIVHAQLAEKETTGPRKLELFKQAISFAAQQEKDDYRGRATLKASELRRRLNQAVRDLQRADTAATSDSTQTTSTH